MAIKNFGYHLVEFEDIESKVFYTQYLPESKKKIGSVIILHGMQEHSGRYDEFANYLAYHGLAVLTYDHPGHGKTARNKDELGFLHKKKPGELLIKVGISMSEFFNAQHPELPHFILGHSLGSFITRNVIREIGKQFRGVVLVGTGSSMNGGSIGTFFLGLLNKVSTAVRSQFMNDKFGQINNAKFKDEPNFEDLNWLSLSERNRQNYLDDELSGIDFSNNAFYGAAQVAHWGTKSNWYKNVPKGLSFLLVSGEDDPIGDFGNGVKQTVGDLLKNGNKDVLFHLYPKLRHELLNEEVKKEVYFEILEWIQERV